MRRQLFFLLFVTIASFATANAQVPVAGAAQATPLKVGVINSAMFGSTTGGITKYVAALRMVETEFKPRREEIATLMTRLETLQKQPTTNSTQAQLLALQEQSQSLQTEIRRKQEDARAAYTKRLTLATDPIRLNIFNALEAYSKARGVDLLVDIAKFPDGILLVSKNADMTAAFIKDFNSKNP